MSKGGEATHIAASIFYLPGIVHIVWFDILSLSARKPASGGVKMKRMGMMALITEASCTLIPMYCNAIGFYYLWFNR